MGDRVRPSRSAPSGVVVEAPLVVEGQWPPIWEETGGNKVQDSRSYSFESIFHDFSIDQQGWMAPFSSHSHVGAGDGSTLVLG